MVLKAEEGLVVAFTLWRMICNFLAYYRFVLMLFSFSLISL